MFAEILARSASRALLLSISILLATASALAPTESVLSEPWGDSAAQLLSAAESPCSSSILPTLDTTAIRGCETVTVRVDFGTRCVAPVINIAFVVPEYAVEGRWLIDTAETILDIVAATPGVSVRGAYVGYSNGRLETRAPLTSDLESIRRLVRATSTSGAVIPSAKAVSEALSYLEAGRESALEAGNPAPVEIIVVFATLKPIYEAEGLREIAKSHSLLRAYGAATLIACSDVERTMWCEPIKDMVPRGGGFVQALDTRMGPRFIEEELERRLALWADPSPKHLEVRQQFGSRLSFVEGSASLPPSRFREETDFSELRWSFTSDLEAASPITFTLEASDKSAIGASTISSRLTITNTDDTSSTVSGPLTSVSITGPCEIPSPTSSATDSPTATPYPTATNTPVPEPLPVYLPLALTERCDPTRVLADVALVLDTSTSMIGDKLAAARSAAKAFVRAVDLPNDRVGVAAFNTDARMVHTLSDDETSLFRAIDALAPGSGTRIDRGLEAGMEILADARTGPNVSPVLILLTDGIQDAEPEAPAIVAARAIASGITVHVVGLGTDVDFEFLLDVAGSTRRLHLSPSPDELEAIYTGIAGEIPCPAGAFWGRR